MVRRVEINRTKIKLIVPISNPCPKKDLMGLKLISVDIRRETMSAQESVNMECRGISSERVLNIEIRYKTKDTKTPEVMTMVFIISIGAYTLGKKTNGANKIVIRKMIKETFSNLFVMLLIIANKKLPVKEVF
jgi:hypothetical protein